MQIYLKFVGCGMQTERAIHTDRPFDIMNLMLYLGLDEAHPSF